MLPSMVMKSRQTKLSPALLGGIFFGIGLAGFLFLGWGELRLGFLLLVYCLVIIGSRLDQIASLLESIDGKLTTARPVGSTRPPDADRPPPESQTLP